MSSQSGLVNTQNSMLIVDENAFPVNLGRTVREDAPEGSFRVIAFAGENVLPTALGYSSYFSDNSVLGQSPLPTVNGKVHCQAVLAWQAPDTSTVLVALCEEGLYWCNATDDLSTGWDLLYSTGNDPADLIRHQWSWAIVANKLCMYSQGQAEFLVLADTATIFNLESQAGLFPGSTVNVLYDDATSIFGFATIIPTFLNMAGQLGLFRADNRLGFWDADNAVAWSSATQIMDCTPSTETFAGVTTFARVQGNIARILGHGNGFVIYATRSIVICRSEPGSPERFSGSAVLSDAGVSFDTEACTGATDDVHYALTSAGLVSITNGVPEFIHTEVSDYLQEHSKLISLAVVDGRYLFLYTDTDLRVSGIGAGVDSIFVGDGSDQEFNMLPTVEDSGVPPLVLTDFSDPEDTSWITYRIDGSNGEPNDRWEINEEEGKLQSKEILPNPSFGVVWGVSRFLISEDLQYGAEGSFRILGTLTINVTSLTGSPYLTIPGGYTGSLALGVHTFDLDVTSGGASGILYLFEFTGGRIGQSGGSRVYLDNYTILDNNFPVGLTPGQILGTTIDGSGQSIQDGLGNFLPKDNVTIENTPKVLIPCYDGGKFSSDWMHPGFSVNIIDAPIQNISLGFNFFSPWQGKNITFTTPFGTGTTGPTYKDADDPSQCVRFIDAAGEVYVQILTESLDNIWQATANTMEAVGVGGVNISVAEDWIESPVFGLDVYPYPLFVDLVAAGFPLLEQDSYTDEDWMQENTEFAIQDVIRPGTLGLKANECKMDVVANVTDAKSVRGLRFDVEFITDMYYENISIYYWTTSGTPVYIVGVATVALNAETIAEINAAWTAEFPDAGYWGGSGFSSLGVAGGGAGTGALPFPNAYVYMRFPHLMQFHLGPSYGGSTSIAELGAAVEWCIGKYYPNIFGEQDELVAGYDPVLDIMHFPDVIVAARLYKHTGGHYAVTNYLSGASDIEFPPTAVFPPYGPYPLIGAEDFGPREDPPSGWDDDVVMMHGFGSIPVGGHLSLPAFYEGIYFSPGNEVVTPNRTIASYGFDGITSETLDRSSHVYTKGNIVKRYFTMIPNASHPDAQPLFFHRASILPLDMTPEEVEIRYNAVDAVAASFEASGGYNNFLVAVRAATPLKPQHLQLRYKWQLAVGIDPEAAEEEKVLFASEVSGYGHFNGGFNFRKTHTRSSATTCPVPTDILALDQKPIVVTVFPPYPGIVVKPADTWPYPGNPVIPDTFTLFRKGSYSAFYPTYKAAIFWDILLDKWGRYNHDHLTLISLLAVNRADQTVLPIDSKSLRGASLRPDGYLVNWAGESTGDITYGRIGDYRLGVTFVTKVVIRFAEPANCNIIIEASIDGSDVDPALTVGTAVTDARQVEVPFTSAVKWFNIRFEGQFNLVGISFQSEARGRR